MKSLLREKKLEKVFETVTFTVFHNIFLTSLLIKKLIYLNFKNDRLIDIIIW